MTPTGPAVHPDSASSSAAVSGKENGTTLRQAKPLPILPVPLEELSDVSDTDLLAPSSSNAGKSTPATSDGKKDGSTQNPKRVKAEGTQADPEFSWESVKSKALQTLAAEKSPEGARSIFSSTIAEWVAKYEQEKDSWRKNSIADAICHLWCEFADMEKTLKQFKQAVKVFESAISCPVAGKRALVWIRYAEYYVERQKHGNANKVFLRAIESMTIPEVLTVWEHFLTHVNSMNKSASPEKPELTMEALQASALSPEKLAEFTAELKAYREKEEREEVVVASIKSPTQIVREKIAQAKESGMVVDLEGEESQPSPRIAPRSAAPSQSSGPISSTTQPPSVMGQSAPSNVGARPVTSMPLGTPKGGAILQQPRTPGPILGALPTPANALRGPPMPRVPHHPAGLAAGGRQNIPPSSFAPSSLPSHAGVPPPARSYPPSQPPPLHQPPFPSQRSGSFPSPSFSPPSHTPPMRGNVREPLPMRHPAREPSPPVRAPLRDAPSPVAKPAVTTPPPPPRPSLLFDPLPSTVPTPQVPEGVLVNLSEVLQDRSVFDRVQALYDAQVARDQDYLRRWGALYNGQADEGARLAQTHKAELAREGGQGSPQLLKQQQTERECFSAKCRAAQSAFVNVTGGEFRRLLGEQQQQLQRLRLPLMFETADVEKVELQRHLVQLILTAKQMSGRGPQQSPTESYAAARGASAYPTQPAAYSPRHEPSPHSPPPPTSDVYPSHRQALDRAPGHYPAPVSQQRDSRKRPHPESYAHPSPAPEGTQGYYRQDTRAAGYYDERGREEARGGRGQRRSLASGEERFGRAEGGRNVINRGDYPDDRDVRGGYGGGAVSYSAGGYDGGRRGYGEKGRPYSYPGGGGRGGEGYGGPVGGESEWSPNRGAWREGGGAAQSGPYYQQGQGRGGRGGPRGRSGSQGPPPYGGYPPGPY